MALRYWPGCRTWGRRALAIPLLFALGAGGWAGGIQLTGNVHAVKPNEIYRSAQINGPKLAGVLDKYGIKTVINLRGVLTARLSGRSVLPRPLRCVGSPHFCCRIGRHSTLTCVASWSTRKMFSWIGDPATGEQYRRVCVFPFALDVHGAGKSAARGDPGLAEQIS